MKELLKVFLLFFTIKYILGDGLSNNKFDVISNNSNMQPVSDIDFKKSLF